MHIKKALLLSTQDAAQHKTITANGTYTLTVTTGESQVRCSSPVCSCVTEQLHKVKALFFSVQHEQKESHIFFTFPEVDSAIDDLCLYLEENEISLEWWEPVEPDEKKDRAAIDAILDEALDIQRLLWGVNARPPKIWG